MSKKKKIIIGIVIALGVFIFAVIIGFFIYRAKGKKEIYEANEESKIQEEGIVGYKGKKYKYNDKLLTFLVMGIDNFGKMPEAGRNRDEIDYWSGGQADVLALVVYNPKEKDFRIIPINRNTMTDVDTYFPNGDFLETKKAQINVQYGFGDGRELSSERQVKCVSNFLYNIPINGYCALTWGGLSKIVDSVGGVEITALESVPMSRVYTSWKDINKGDNVILEGDSSLYYIRWRDEEKLDSADFRLEKQKQFMSALISAIKKKIKSNPGYALEIMKSIDEYMVTDITSAEITYLATEIADADFSMNNIVSYTGETILGEDGFAEFHADDDSVYDLVINTFYNEVKEEKNSKNGK